VADAIANAPYALETEVKASVDRLQDQINDLYGAVPDFTEDANLAYAKAIPASTDLLRYALIKSFGGRSIVWNQLVGADTESVTLAFGRKYLTVINGAETIQDGDDSDIAVTGGTDMVFDLTHMFGGSREPATVAEFHAIFPAEYYAYSAGEIMNIPVTRIDSIGADGETVLDSKEIPAAIRSLIGYGLGAGAVGNEIDWENKKFIQRVEEVDLGTLNWGVDGDAFRTTSTRARIKPTPDNNTAVNAVALPYATIIVSGRTGKDKAMLAFPTGNTVIYDSDYTDPAEFTAAMSGVMMRYELLNPIVTDISDILDGFDNLIRVEPGGTLVFRNAVGESYRVPVPSSVLTMNKPSQ
jgi:hypothetical protein